MRKGVCLYVCMYVLCVRVCVHWQCLVCKGVRLCVGVFVCVPVVILSQGAVESGQLPQLHFP